MPARAGVVGVLLAAGASERFGEGVKALAELGGRRLHEWPLAALRGGGVEDVVVVVGAAPFAVDGAEVVRCEGWAEGMAASLRAGVGAARARGAQAVVIALADQPLLDPRAVARVLAARAPGVSAIRATYEDRAGHPTLIESSLFDAVAALRGDVGARPLLGGAKLVACDGLGSPEDVDTPEALAAMEARLVDRRGGG
jgi:CTP:molybdopterin cytidylyltransferase MocA